MLITNINNVFVETREGQLPGIPLPTIRWLPWFRHHMPRRYDDDEPCDDMDRRPNMVSGYVQMNGTLRVTK